MAKRKVSLDVDVLSSIEKYIEEVKKHYNVDSVILFGSYVSGNPHKDSDIDVGVVFDGFTGDWRQTAKRLWCLRREISFDIEPHLLDSANDQSGFVKHVIKTGQIIYQA